MVVTLLILSCNSKQKENNQTEFSIYPDIKIVGAMKDVMRKGKLRGCINLDTISNNKGLYGLGPLSYLKGEILINDGNSYVSKVLSDSTMVVEKSWDLSAPFFVYGNVLEWEKLELPTEIKTIQNVEKYIDKKTADFKRPFAFKLIGEVSTAVIHIQNLADGTRVSSPADAHQGQTNYSINNENVEIIGFFSTEHKGVFTHHDSFLHMHLITSDEAAMGHLDELEIKRMTLYLPKK